MNSLMQVEQWMSRFTYKPNVSFQVFTSTDVTVFGGGSEIFIRATQYVQDSRARFKPWVLERSDYDDEFAPYSPYAGSITITTSPGWVSPRVELLPVTATNPVPQGVIDQGEDTFYDWLRRVVIRSLEMHEMDEWCKVDGEVRWDPHA